MLAPELTIDVEVLADHVDRRFADYVAGRDGR